MSKTIYVAWKGNRIQKILGIANLNFGKDTRPQSIQVKFRI